jgi:bifunctional non-homologous end joining protein LigD
MLCEREATNLHILARTGWLYELKLDGVRIVADKRDDRVALYYRKQRDATENYREIAEAVRALTTARVVLDGEIVAFDEHGRPDFQRLGHRIQTTDKSTRRTAVPVVYVVFDVLAVGPYDIRHFPLEARKEVLSRILRPEGGLVRQHPTFETGVDLFRLCREQRLEGVVAKRLGSSYKAGERSIDWLKIKCELDAEFVVIGWTEGESTRARLGALDLGAYDGDRLVFRGRVGSGLDEDTIDLLLERLLPMEVPHPVAHGKYSPKPKRHHCRPEMVVSVRYGGFSLDPSGARFLRFPVFRGIRDDVSPMDCTVRPDEADSSGAPDAGASTLPEAPPAVDASRARRIHVTGPGRALFADGTTRATLCSYFEAVGPTLLGHTKSRVCTLARPDGTTLWPPPKWTPTFVRSVITTKDTRGDDVRGFLVDSIDALLFAVEAGAPSILHGSFDHDQPDTADFVALRVSAKKHGQLVRGARIVRALADEIGLPSAPKLGGPTSIDVILGLGKAKARAAAPLGALVAHLVNEEAGPDVSIAAVDTVVTPFAPCAGARTVVAIPLSWDELDDVDLAGVGLPAAIARVTGEAGQRLLDTAERPADVAAAAAAIERVLGARMRPLG